MRRPIFFWFRRDLRWQDNAALAAAGELASKEGVGVRCVFVFDTEILGALGNPGDRRVAGLHHRLARMDAEAKKQGSGIRFLHGSPKEAWGRLLAEAPGARVFWNRDYEPATRARDAAVARLVAEAGGECFESKDHLVFDRDEILTRTGTPYSVFTPYFKAWEAALVAKPESTRKRTSEVPLEKGWGDRIPGLAELGFEASPFEFPAPRLDAGVIAGYEKTRDLPAREDGTTRSGPALRFGILGVREALRVARAHSRVFLGELAWRDFFAQVLWHHPRTATESFRAEGDAVAWRSAPGEFEAWCEGRTGFPLVDAGMRELVATGFMHNRVRMVTASFLTKQLLVDWRRGEAFFARHLLDYDLASNVGNWQWAASTGCDAAPYFRVFSPERQAERFDPEGAYVRRWVPEAGTPSYPAPMVEPRFARERALAAWAKARALVTSSRNPPRKA